MSNLENPSTGVNDAITGESPAEAAPASNGLAPKRPRTASLVVLYVVFGLFFAWDLWEAASSAVALPQQIAYFNDLFQIDQPVPWSALIANIVVPPAAFIAAVLIGRGRPLIERGGALLAGLCASAALTLTLTAYVNAGGL
ncbi:hypothetical protein [Ruicaihuangia caeni]|uniref:Uncharacterized protein n=1 Tax=Ruicaihuangia caeni TaxID=3042517 RepID=A0AAW6T395_9MICO|nr:hypothetical protein [Klugiella sp. YN-L-19]MDI2097576.1 hypothetical protein [Klugiella sp. YN-L-19]